MNRVRKDIAKDQILGALVLLIGAALILTFFDGTLHGHVYWFPLGFGLLCFACWRYLRHETSRRRHGIRTEKESAPRGARCLQQRGFEVKRNVAFRNIGDVDILAQRGRVKTPIEVKSFRSWNPHEPRCTAALRQVGRQQARLRAQIGFVWLPDCSNSLVERCGDTIVIGGGPRSMSITVDRNVRALGGAWWHRWF